MAPLRPKPPARTGRAGLCDSDQGSQYTSIAFGHPAGREGRMAPPGAEQKNGDATEDKMVVRKDTLISSPHPFTKPGAGPGVCFRHIKVAAWLPFASG